MGGGAPRLNGVVKGALEAVTAGARAAATAAESATGGAQLEASEALSQFRPALSGCGAPYWAPSGDVMPMLSLMVMPTAGKPPFLGIGGAS